MKRGQSHSEQKSLWSEIWHSLRRSPPAPAPVPGEGPCSLKASLSCELGRALDSHFKALPPPPLCWSHSPSPRRSANRLPFPLLFLCLSDRKTAHSHIHMGNKATCSGFSCSQGYVLDVERNTTLSLRGEGLAPLVFLECVMAETQAVIQAHEVEPRVEAGQHKSLMNSWSCLAHSLLWEK